LLTIAPFSFDSLLPLPLNRTPCLRTRRTQVGSLKSDFNTGEFSYSFPTEQTIELHSDHTLVQYAHYNSVSFHQLLPALAKVLKRKTNVSQPPSDRGLQTEIPDGPADKVVTQAAFWPMMGKFFEEGDVVVAETGTSSFGMISTPLPRGSTFVSQVRVPDRGRPVPD
jgi:pyruvate decarboxylase